MAWVYVKVARQISLHQVATLAKLAFKEYLKTAKVNRGRPKYTWISQINNDLKWINMSVES